MARIYLTDFARDYAALNALWPGSFATQRLPACTTVGVAALGLGALIEIDLIARRP
jgi:enamine deaminase RidA (YjgF/YER057c/UK114 family)